MTFIMLAPMEGVLDPLMREIYSQVGGFDRFVTEFIRITNHVHPANVYFEHCPELLNGGTTKEGTPVFVQLLGSAPAVVADNAAFVAELGAPGIDLNFGCPAKTVNRHDGGAALLKNPQRVFDVVSAVRRSVPSQIPVTAKVRLGFSDKSLAREIAIAADSAGAAMLTIHARTRDEGYRPPAHWEYIAQMAEVVKTATVVANGDIWTVEDYIKCRQISGCPNVALGRGAIASPNLALQIRRHLAGEATNPYSWETIKLELLSHFLESYERNTSDYVTTGRLKQWLRQLGRHHSEALDYFEVVKGLHSTKEIRQTLFPI